ncbi:helix-turn-helix transcriptional regulator [Actinophytocola algeriensis]|uniref:DNA-binding NarL/FixJ family response regulator n=1 Tax=Actinophytocola algeriensis TaxID=1768010 RepID=A0A7W7VIH2_9PSEU|nr:LuxR family transcriptional regulator [Actinophytocola algeriensis]MBB4911562.1 DNA-binding NarL/FixJ family response regulator [Actinophytocola algeriensis]MBE1473450.1 DNA-binding NarL/FixJ family response regulator [Actinophytocola algeriensis]
MALLERDRELATAQAVTTAAARGHGGVLVVGGPPGAGRTALLDAVCAAVPADFVRLRADAAVAERDFAFGVVQQLFQPLVSTATDGDLDRWLRGPAAPVRGLLLDEPWSVDHEAGEAVLHGLHSFLLNVSEDRPVLLAADDLQWADTPSLRWLGYLGRRVRSARILVACALCDGRDARDPRLLDDFRATAEHSVEPAPLSPYAVRRLLADESGWDCPPAAAVACHEVTGGNPGAVRAVLDGLRAERSWSFRAQDLQPLLRERRLADLASAPVEVRTMASALAVLGDAAEPDLLCGLSGMDHLAYKSSVAALERAGLLADTDSPRLVHDSVRDGVLAALPAPVRTRLHRTAARLLRDAAHPAEDVADHLLLGGRGYDHAESAVLRAAAGAALDRGATETAARYLRAALLNHLEQGPERSQLLVALAAAERSAAPGAAARHVTMALPHLTAGVERAVAALSIPPALAATTPALVDVVRDTWADLVAHDPTGRHRQLTARLTARMRLLVLHDHVPGPVATADLDRAEVDDLLGTGAGRELLAVHCYEAALGGTRPRGEVADLLGRVLAREPATPAHVHTALPVLVPTAVAADAEAELTGWLELAGREARRTGSTGERALLDAELAVLHAATGRLGRAQSAATAALSSAGPDWPETTALAVTALTSVALRTQDVELAGRLLANGPPPADPRVAVSLTMLRGMTDALAGDWATALDRFLDCGHRLRRVGWTGAAGPPWREWAVAAHRALGESAAAEALAAEAHRVAQAWGSPGAVGRALLSRASLAGGAEALALVRSAIDALRDSDDRLTLAAALTVLGRRSRELGATGDEAVAEGERIAGERGTYWGAEGSPYGGPVPRPRRTGHVPLTRSEEAVVASVRKGWTNQRIADDLGVTRRAVEKTLTGVYRKLGVSGRGALLRGPEPGE